MYGTYLLAALAATSALLTNAAPVQPWDDGAHLDSHNRFDTERLVQRWGYRKHHGFRFRHRVTHTTLTIYRTTTMTIEDAATASPNAVINVQATTQSGSANATPAIQAAAAGNFECGQAPAVATPSSTEAVATSSPEAVTSSIEAVATAAGAVTTPMVTSSAPVPSSEAVASRSSFTSEQSSTIATSVIQNSTIISISSASPATSTSVAPAAVVSSVTSSTSQVSTTQPDPTSSTAAVSNTNAVVSGITADVIRAIMPQAASCANAPFPVECRTAEQAAPLFASSFAKYGISSKAAQAAVLALVALESGELQYRQAHFGDVVPGKGTRNMESPTFNQKYATAVLGASAIAGKDATGILSALLADDATDFGSGAWFLSTQCPSVLQQFSSSPDAAWSAYLGSNCIGTSDTAQRDAYWAAAKKALGVS